VLQKIEFLPEGMFRYQELTRREGEVVHLVAQGLANKVVAGRLGIQEGTVKIHLHHIFRKLRVANRTSLALTVNTPQWNKR
jgi:DNA-binding NarL/FixJ family response regulator